MLILSQCTFIGDFLIFSVLICRASRYTAGYHLISYTVLSENYAICVKI